MTEPERARFVQRRRNELYEFAFYYLLFGPLLFAVPTLVLALLIAGGVWVLSLTVNDHAWAWLVPTLVVVGCLAGLVFVGSYIRLLRVCAKRCRLPEDAVLRVLTIDREALHECVLGCEPTKDQRDPLAPMVHLELPGLGLCVIPIEDPDEGELRTNEEGCFRVGWSPLRRYFVEWIDVPTEWPGSLSVIRGEIPMGDHWLSSLPDLERLRTKRSADEGGTSPRAES